MTNEPIEFSRAQALSIFTGQMRAMIDVGICLGRIMEVLGEAAPPPYNDFCRPLSDRWKQKENEFLTLSAIMEERPDLFPDFYIKTVKCGEYGGALELSYDDLTELLDDTLRMWAARGRPSEWIRLLLSPDSQGPAEWSALETGQKKLVLYLFCKSLALMLASGVPIILAVDAAAAFIPSRQREPFRADCGRRIREGERLSTLLAEAEFTDPFLVFMSKFGEECGNLDVVLQKVALVYQRELELG